MGGRDMAKTGSRRRSNSDLDTHDKILVYLVSITLETVDMYVLVLSITDSTCSLLCVLQIMYCCPLCLCLTGRRRANVYSTGPY